MSYISKISVQDTVYEIIADKNLEKKILATQEYANNAISAHNTSTVAHSDIRELINGLTSRLNTLADSDDTTLDQLSEIVAYIKSNKTLIDAITTSKVNVDDIVNNLTTNVTNKPLSAAQGVELKRLIDTLEKADVGLGNVDNTSDMDKPVSTAQATAIADAKKAGTDAQSNLTTHNTATDAHQDIRNAASAAQTTANNALPKSGGAMTGTIDVSGTGNVLDFGTTGYFRGMTSSGNRFDMFGLIDSTVLRVGGSYPALELKGKNERPTYNNSEVALVSDIATAIEAAFAGIARAEGVEF